MTPAKRALERPKSKRPGLDRPTAPVRRVTGPTVIDERPEGLPPPRRKQRKPRPDVESPEQSDRTQVSGPPVAPPPQQPAELFDDKTVPAQPGHILVHLGLTPAPAELVAPPALDRKLVDPRRFSGSVALSVLRFVSRRFGERALTDLLATLPPLASDTFKHGVTDQQWVPYEAVNALVQHVDARLGRDDLHLVVQCGRAASEGAFDIMRSVRPPSPPPELLLAEMPKVLSRILRGVNVSVGRLGRGYGRLEVDEMGESSLTFCVFLIGFIDRALDRFGASDVEVNLISSPALGDKTGVYEISWIS